MHRTEIRPSYSPLGVVRVETLAGYEVASTLVSRETLEHERRMAYEHTFRCSWTTWRTVCRQRIKNLAFLTASHWKAFY